MDVTHRINSLLFVFLNLPKLSQKIQLVFLSQFQSVVTTYVYVLVKRCSS